MTPALSQRENTRNPSTLSPPCGPIAKLGVILNLTPDHLERHKSMRGYAEAKCRVFEFMTAEDLAVIPAGSGLLAEVVDAAKSSATRSFLGAWPGVTVDEKQMRAHIQLPYGDQSMQEMEVSLADLRAIGAHNIHNAATAVLLALALRLDAAAVSLHNLERGMAALEPPAHRMEAVLRRDHVVWINDSKATNVEATLVGVDGLEKRAVVLLGGQAKKNPATGGLGFGKLAQALERHRAVITFGADGPLIADELTAEGCSCECVSPGGLEAATSRAAQLCQPGEAILLSPGCASFDEFENFMCRGNSKYSHVCLKPSATSFGS
ncbi:hypothetical protein CYMTET_32393 [Cymbomonas tetramitiformis]|uniref:UDP-N-acetylmuramoyl-L-alanine--D-glutamate ligase n=1 Tax=Cymbomonas tetramitiformis TaxID=36881 RepID=A0AAE0FF64_9CHLO|nr:hypothetical protein CYMTET_32393 [Cymbomonas tetramitiformis]